MLRVGLIFTILCFFSVPINADDNDTMIHGGRLYDKWWLDNGLPKPTTTHPSYPSTGKKAKRSRGVARNVMVGTIVANMAFMVKAVITPE